MAKESLGLKKTLGLSPKIEVKKSEVNIEKTEKAVQVLHSTKEETKRLSIDIPVGMYKMMKIKIVGQQTVRDYVLGLVQKDLNK